MANNSTTTSSSSSSASTTSSSTTTSSTDKSSSDSKSDTQQVVKNILVHKLYKYHVESLQLIFPNLTNPVNLEPGSITQMSIQKDFEGSFYPLFRIWISINPRLKEYIMFNKNEVKFRVRLQCDIVDPSTGQIESSEDVFNTLFIPIIGDASPFFDSSVYAKTAQTITEMSDSGATANDLSGNNLTADARQTVEYYLYSEKDLIGSKNVVNEIYSSVNISTALVSLLSENGFDSILLSPPDNQDTIDQLIVPPMALLKVFKYLSDNYGMHVTGTTAFFDYRCIYILNKTGHPKCVEQGEYPKTIFTVQETKNPEARMAGTLACDQTKEYHIYPDPHDIEVMNFSVYNDHINGNNLKLVDSKNNTVSTIGGTGDQRGDGVTRVDNNNTGNSYTKTSYANSVSESNLHLRVMLKDIYFWALTPNKEHLWNWMDSSYGMAYSGYFRPLSTDFWFTKNGDGLSLTVRAEYVKKEDLTEAIKNAIDEEVTPVSSTGSSSVAANTTTAQSSSTTSSSTKSSSSITTATSKIKSSTKIAKTSTTKN